MSAAVLVLVIAVSLCIFGYFFVAGVRGSRDDADMRPVVEPQPQLTINNVTGEPTPSTRGTGAIPITNGDKSTQPADKNSSTPTAPAAGGGPSAAPSPLPNPSVVTPAVKTTAPTRSATTRSTPVRVPQPPAATRTETGGPIFISVTPDDDIFHRPPRSAPVEKKPTLIPGLDPPNIFTCRPIGHGRIAAEVLWIDRWPEPKLDISVPAESRSRGKGRYTIISKPLEWGHQVSCSVDFGNGPRTQTTIAL